jgi:acyl-CoA reductase-like NAD-dependent aldehyde dehydrogenase
VSVAADQGIDARTGAPVGASVPHTAAAELDRVCAVAAAASGGYAELPLARRAGLLREIGAALEAARADIVALGDAETGLGQARLSSELTRTRMQLDLFAAAVEEGSFLEAIIDLADPQAQPAPRPDLRRILVPVGPVAVFAASNFPLAFSVPGGDTASALAAGCPVVVKAHPGHPGLSVLCGQIVAGVMAAAGAPAGTFAIVHGLDAGRNLVGHPAIAAVGFTGSLAAGRALFDVAAGRPDPIPFYGELGAVNPVVVTQAALAERASDIVTGFVGSVTLGSGQFCTKPGLLFLPAGHGLAGPLVAAVEQITVGPLLTSKILDGYADATARLAAATGVRTLFSAGTGDPLRPALFAAPAAALTDALVQECFGPASLVVEYDGTDELLAAMDALPGSLTATVHARLPVDRQLCDRLLDVVTRRAGRIIWGGWPTGVAVTWAMQHGGPWPATTASLHTSVGVTAVRRWQRPVAYQAMPDELLPPALRDANPLGIPRRVNGALRPGSVPSVA